VATTAKNRTPGPIRTLGRVGLWGAPGSGKTTFLAALNIAVNRASEDLLIYGVDDASTDFLVDNTAMLTQRREFPAATKVEQQLSWAMHLQTQVPVRSRFGRQTMTSVPTELNIDLLDAPGGRFASVPDEGVGGGILPAGSAALGFDDEDDDTGPALTDESLLDQLASCDGIVLLFDPIRERERGDAYHYFQGTLLRIAQRRMADRLQAGTKLPHFVAVCLTKFDDPDVYRRATTRGYREFSTDDPRMFPRVPNEEAENFFGELCREADRGNADLVPEALRRYFMPGRVRFFVTSAIGFYLSKKAPRFQERDFQNVVAERGGSPRIRGPIYPINVVEPLLWLGQSLAGR
jgi:energy-coupling factor transporter ATP-binding protein EcfA2